MLFSAKDCHTFYKTSHARIIMTVIVAARILIIVQGFSSKVEWTAKMTHVSIKVTTLNFINWAHLGSSGLIWAHLGSSGLIWAHLGSSGLTWAHLNSSGLIWSHLASWLVGWMAIAGWVVVSTGQPASQAASEAAIGDSFSLVMCSRSSVIPGCGVLTT